MRASKLLNGGEKDLASINSGFTLNDKCIGKTTAGALQAIGIAMSNPDQEIYVDEQNVGVSYQQSNKVLYSTIISLISRLKLQFLEVTKESTKCTITYRPYGEYELRWSLKESD